MAERIRGPVNNPLTLIAVFAGLAEVAATVALPMLDGHVQAVFIWFVMLFPVLLVVLFFITLNFNHRVLYAPSDFANESHFLILQGRYVPPAIDGGSGLRTYWKPDGRTSNPENERKLLQWLQRHGYGEVSVSAFIYGDEYRDARSQAEKELLGEGIMETR